MRFALKIAAFLMLCLSYGCGDLDSSSLEHDQVMAGEQGAPGDSGATGATGERGPMGPQGPTGIYTMLVDQTGVEVGQYLERVDFTDNKFEIMTVDGFRTVVALDDASFAPPTQMGGAAVSCMYQSNDCSGSCFGPDERARGYLLNGQDGQVYAVDINAATQSITFDSYNEISALGTCVVLNGLLPTAVPTQVYGGVMTQSLSSPLYFTIVNPAGE